ncbi:unnamed protein product [Gadus morhua 'NCC']
MFSNCTPQNTSNAENLTDVYEAARWIQLSMAVLSIVGSGSILVFSASQKLFQSQEVRPLLLLSAADLLLAVSWLVGAALYTPDPETHPACCHLHTVEQILYTTSFSYTLLYVWRLLSDLMGQEASNVLSPKILAVVAGLLPWLLMSPVLIKANLLRCYANCSQPYRCLLMQTGPLCLGGEQGDCWLLHAYRDLIFLLTFLITLVGITVLMEKARRIHRRVVTSGGFLGDRQWANLRMLDRRMLLYPAVFIFCWGPAVCVTALSWIRPAALQGALAAALYLIQALASGSQGALNSLAYGWTRSRFREAGPRRSELQDATTQTPLLRAQRPGYRTLGPDRGAPPGPPRGRSPSPHT